MDHIADAFISYSPKDEEWVLYWLLPRLEERGLKICVESRDFDPGVPKVESIERAILNSRHAVIVLSPEWIENEWNKFHFSLAQSKDPAACIPYILPIVIRPCRPPLRISHLNSIDFTNEALWFVQVERLIEVISRSTIRQHDDLRVVSDDYSDWSGVDLSHDGLHSSMLGMMIANMIKQEVRESLSQTTIFRKREYTTLLKDIVGLRYYKGINPEKLVAPEELSSTFAASLGLRYANKRVPILRERITVALPVTMVGAIALFYFLETIKGIDLVVDCSCCNGTDVLRKVKTGKANAAILPVGGSSTLIRQQSKLDFFPLTIMPAGSYAIMSQREAKNLLDIRTIAMPTDRPSSAVSYCDELRAQAIIKDARYQHSEYYDTLNVLRDSDIDTAVAQWFPNYKFSELVGYRSLFRSSPSDGAHYSLATFLFLRGNLFSDPLIREWLSVSIRDAWLELLERPASFARILDLMLRRDDGFLPKALKRCSGVDDNLIKSAVTRISEEKKPLL